MQGRPQVQFNYHRRNDANAPFSELLDVTQKSDNDKMELNAIQGFMDIRGKSVDQFDTDEMKQFRKFIDAGDVRLGPYLE